MTKPNNRVLLIAYSSPAEFNALQLFIAALQSINSNFENLPKPPPLEFQVSNPAVMRARLVTAGLADVRINTTAQERVEVSTNQKT